MLEIMANQVGRNCQGVTRRAALKAGLLGFGGLALADVLRAKANSPALRSDLSVILIWLDGGPSQLETFDPKPEAPAEYRGPWGALRTTVPGTLVSELMPEVARRAHKVSLIRSLHHDNGDHFAAGHWMLTGRFGATAANQASKYPSLGSIIAKVKGSITPGLPPYVGLPAAHAIYVYPGYMGAAYLGAAYNPFDVDRVRKYLPATDHTRVRTPRWLSSMATPAGAQPLFTLEATQQRLDLLKQLDTLRRDVDRSGVMASMDHFQQQAIDLILGSKARDAFDIEQEDPRTLDRYGTSVWGQYTAMARRLVEAGVRFVTVDMPHWDDHSSLEKNHGRKVPVVDRAVGALIDDLDDRGMLDRVMVVVMGEFGRTPKINKGLPNDPVPGRDHWGQAISVLVAGGGLAQGIVVGRTNDKAEHPVERPLKPADLLATIYHQLGIDTEMTFNDPTGRPIPILDQSEPIRELV